MKLKKDKSPRDDLGVKESSPQPGCPPVLLIHGHPTLTPTAISSELRVTKAGPSPAVCRAAIWVRAFTCWVCFIICHVTTTRCGSESDKKTTFHPPSTALGSNVPDRSWPGRIQALCSAGTKVVGDERPAPAARSQGPLGCYSGVSIHFFWRGTEPCHESY